MEVVYTNHAEGQIKERCISKEKVESALMAPDKTVDSRDGTKAVQKLDGKKLLRVIYKQDNNTYIVITVYYTAPDRY